MQSYLQLEKNNQQQTNLLDRASKYIQTHFSYLTIPQVDNLCSLIIEISKSLNDQLHWICVSKSYTNTPFPNNGSATISEKTFTNEQINLFKEKLMPLFIHLQPLSMDDPIITKQLDMKTTSNNIQSKHTLTITKLTNTTYPSLLSIASNSVQIKLKLELNIPPKGYHIAYIPLDIKSSQEIHLAVDLISPQTNLLILIDNLYSNLTLPYTATRLLIINPSDRTTTIPPSITTTIKLIPKITNIVQPQVNIQFFPAPFQGNFPKPLSNKFQHPTDFTHHIATSNKLQTDLHEMDVYLSNNICNPYIRYETLNTTHSIDSQYLEQPYQHPHTVNITPDISRHNLQMLSVNSEISIPFQEDEPGRDPLNYNQELDKIKNIQLNYLHPQLPDIAEENELQANPTQPPQVPPATTEEEELTEWKRYYLSNLQLPFDLNPQSLPPLTTNQKQLIFHSTTLPHRQLTRDQLAALQQTDDFCKSKLNDIQSLPTNRQTQPTGFYIFQGILCHYSIQNDVKQARIVIPESVTMDLYRSIHAHYGHLSKEKTLAIYKKFFFSKSFDVNHIHKSCLICKVNKNLRPLPPPGDIRTDQELINAPRQSIFMDIADSIKPSSSSRMKHVLIIVDSFSQFLQLAPLPDKKSTSILKAYKLYWSNSFGHPYCITSDNSNSFLLDFKEHLVRYGIVTRTSLPYSQYQDLAEIGVKLFKDKLRALFTDPQFITNNKDWDKILPDICQIVNSAPLSKPFRYSREKLHFGNALNHICPFAFYASKNLNETPPIPTLADLGQFGPFTDFITNMYQSIDEIRNQHKNIQHEKRRQINNQTQPKKGSHLFTQFHPGMLVFITTKPKNLRETGEPKRRLYRILASSKRGITAVDVQTFETIRSTNFASIEIPTHDEFSFLYPKHFFNEIQALSKDLYKRYQPVGLTIQDQISQNQQDPHLDLQHPTTNDDEEIVIDLPTNAPTNTRVLRGKEIIKYPK